MNLWTLVERLQNSSRKAAPILYVAVGLGLSRGCLAWVFNMVRYSEIGSPYATLAQYVVGMGEATMFFVLAAWARRRTLLRDSPLAYGLPFFLLPGGFLLLAFVAPWASFAIQESAGLLVFLLGCAVAAAGYAILLTLWFEQMTTLSPRHALCAFGVAYFVNILMWLTCTQATSLLSTAICIVATFFSSSLLVRSHQTTSTIEIPSRAFPKAVISLRLISWIAVLALAFGIGEGSTEMGYATPYAKIGMGLPELLVLLGLALPLKRFDIGVFCRLTTVLVSVGLAGIFFSGSFHAVAQTLLSSSVESLQMFAIMVACFTARQHRASAACYGALVMGVFTLCVRLGQVIQRAIPHEMDGVYIALLLLVVVLSIALLREDKFDSQLHLDRAPTPGEAFYRDLASRHGLSKREESVFLLLLQGNSYDQIGEELFMAPSTVRAHASRIFKKFGIHTRQELQDKAASSQAALFPRV